ncbi:hypothetical protein BJX63DRAFT_304994 [Aspergillus granulosus]|uniref:Uncharacterized protein n=1 Tax=Aspergillus granulosus TaxID=176169 RepID=A0ABR4H5U2_9EURO
MRKGKDRRTSCRTTFLSHLNGSRNRRPRTPFRIHTLSFPTGRVNALLIAAKKKQIGGQRVGFRKHQENCQSTLWTEKHHHRLVVVAKNSKLEAVLEDLRFCSRSRLRLVWLGVSLVAAPIDLPSCQTPLAFLFFFSCTAILTDF